MTNRKLISSNNTIGYKANTNSVSILNIIATPDGVEAAVVLRADLGVGGSNTHDEHLIIPSALTDRTLNNTYYRVVTPESPFVFASTYSRVDTWVESVEPVSNDANGVVSVAIPAIGELPQGLELNSTTGVISGSCKQFKDFSVFPVVRVTAESPTAISADPQSYNITISADGTLSLHSSNTAMDFDSQFLVSAASWVGIQCTAESELSFQTWFMLPFHFFPRIIGSNMLPRGSVNSLTYWFGIIGIGAPFAIVAVVVAIIWPSTALWETCRNVYRRKSCFRKRRKLRTFSETASNTAAAQEPTSTTEIDTSAANSSGVSEELAEEARQLSEDIKGENAKLTEILTPPPWHIRRLCFAAILCLLAASIAAVVGVIAAAVTFTDITVTAETCDSYIDQFSSLAETALKLSSSITQELEDSNECFEVVSDSLNLQQDLLSSLVSYTDQTNWIMVSWLRYAVPQVHVAQTILVVAVCLSAVGPGLMMWSSLLTCFTFRWKNGVTCKRTAEHLDRLVSPTTVTLAVVEWCALSLLTMVFTTLSDVCWSPVGIYLPYHSDDVDALTYLPDPLSPASFNLGKFFSGCHYQFGDGMEGVSQAGFNMTQFNPHSILIVSAAHAGQALVEVVSKTAQCSQSTSIVGSLVEQIESQLSMALDVSGCDTLGTEYSAMVHSMCNPKGSFFHSISLANILFSLVVGMLIIAISQTIMIPYLSYLKPNMARLAEAERYHKTVLLKRERWTELRQKYPDIENSVGLLHEDSDFIETTENTHGQSQDDHWRHPSLASESEFQTENEDATVVET